MNDIELIAGATALGFKANTPIDANKTLAEVIGSRDRRFWEAFPVLLANAAKGGRFSYETADACLPEGEKKFLKLLIIVSLGLYESLGINSGWKTRLSGAFPARLAANFRQKIDRNEELELGPIRVKPETLKANFLEGFAREGSPGTDPRTGADARLEAALAQIFTPRQRELLLKKVRREALTKTEREYFSRVIKKKALALADEELHRLARRALD